MNSFPYPYGIVPNYYNPMFSNGFIPPQMMVFPPGFNPLAAEFEKNKSNPNMDYIYHMHPYYPYNLGVKGPSSTDDPAIKANIKIEESIEMQSHPVFHEESNINNDQINVKTEKDTALNLKIENVKLEYVQKESRRKQKQESSLNIPENNTNVDEIPSKAKKASRVSINREKTLKIWGEKEDNELINLADRFSQDWKKISKKFMKELHSKITPGFIKQRYIQICKTPEKKGIKFTNNEDMATIYYLFVLKEDWANISQYFNGRTYLMIKNRLNYLRTKSNFDELMKQACDEFKKES